MSEPRYLLFPHTILPPTEFRHLAILLPRLDLLQISRQPSLPEWARGFLHARPTITEDLANQTNLLLKEYRNFASLIGDSSVLATMGQFSDEDIWRESRFRIQSHLKGRDRAKSTEASLLAALEASVFMEMAHELDQQSMELRRGIAQAENLEREFLDILGVGAEEGEEDPLEVGDWRLPSEDNYMNFQLRKKIGFWLRLFASSAKEEMPVLVTVTPEVLAEIVDPLVHIGDPSSDPASIVFRTTLAPMPALSRLDSKEFGEVLASLRSSDILTAYLQSIERVLGNPKDLDGIEELEASASQLKKLLAEYGTGEETGDRRQSRLSVVTCSDLTIGDLWKRFDKSSSEITVSSPILGQPVVVILYERDFVQ